MSSGTKFDTLAEIRRYIESKSRDQILRDIEATRFDAYAGIGVSITKDSLLPVPNSLIDYRYTEKFASNADFSEFTFQLASA